MSANNSRRRSNRSMVPAQLQAGQAWAQPMQPGYVSAQVAQYQAPGPMAPRDPFYATSPPWPQSQQGKPIIITPLDPNTGAVRVNPRTKKPAIALLNPVDGLREREYVLSHTKKGVQLRNQYAQLYAPFATALPGVGVSRSRTGATSRRTPSINGQTIQFYNPTDSFTDQNGQTQGTLVTFGGSSYNRLLPAWAGSQQFAERLIANLSMVNQQLAQYVLNDINNGRIGQYIENPRPSTSGRRGNLIKVGSQTYNELLLSGYAGAITSAPTITEAEVNQRRLQNKAVKAQAAANRVNLPQVSITNPETNRTFIQVGGPTFNALLNNPYYEAEVRARANAVGIANDFLDQLKASGIQRSNSTRGRASARSSAGRAGPRVQAAAPAGRLSNPAGSIQLQPARTQVQYQQPTAQRLSAVQPFAQPVQPQVSVAPVQQQLPAAPFQQVSPNRTLVPGGPFVGVSGGGSNLRPLSAGQLNQAAAANEF